MFFLFVELIEVKFGLCLEKVTFLASPAYVRNPHLRAKFINFLQQLVPYPDLPEAAASLRSVAAFLRCVLDCGGGGGGGGEKCLAW